MPTKVFQKTDPEVLKEHVSQVFQKTSRSISGETASEGFRLIFGGMGVSRANRAWGLRIRRGASWSGRR